MPNQPKTPLKNVRCDDDLWERFGTLAEPDRSAVLRQFMRWYCGEPGVTRPKRPAAPGADDLWERFGNLAEPDGATVLRRLARWYCREPRVTLPKRPDAPGAAGQG